MTICSNIAASLSIALLVLMMNCEACNKSLPIKAHVKQNHAEHNKARFAIDGSSIFSKTKQFVFTSSMNITTTSSESTEENIEHIEILGQQPRLVFKKKIDGAHFFEIFKDDEQFFVKSKAHEYRRANDSYARYQTLINDGFNIVAFIMQQFSLDNSALIEEPKQKNLVYIVKPAAIALDAPFLLHLKKNFPDTSLASSSVSGVFIVEKKMNMPIEAQFDIALETTTKTTITLKAQMKFNHHTDAFALTPPVVKEEEPWSHPVDVSRRFNELLQGKANNG